MLISSGIVLLVIMFLSLFCALTFVGVYTLLGNGFGVFSGFYSLCVYESLLVSVVLDYLSCITVFLVPLHLCASVLSVLL